MPTLISIRTTVMAVVCPVALLNLMACTPSTVTPAAATHCPGIGSIHQAQEAQGYSYSAIAPGGGWTGENPYAQEHYLKGMTFESAAIRTGQAGPGQPQYYFVACDYEGPQQFAFLRMSQRFPQKPTAVGPNWSADGFCRATSEDGCPFTTVTPVP